MRNRLAMVTIMLLCAGCSLLPAKPPANAAQMIVPRAEPPPPPPEWLTNPTGFGKEVRGYETSVRLALVNDALAEFAATPNMQTHSRLALLLDSGVVSLRDHLETVVRIDHMLENETALDPQAVAVLRMQTERLNGRIASLQSLAAARKRNDRLARQVRELESSQSEAEAALEVAHEKIEALKSIEQSLRR